MSTETRTTSLRWNRTAVPVTAAIVLAAEIGGTLVFANPRLAWPLISVWFVITCFVQFWGNTVDRVVALGVLAAMVVVAFLPVLLSGSTTTGGGSDGGVTVVDMDPGTPGTGS